MDMQNVSNLQIPEGAVRTIHDKDNRLIWGRLAYDTKYAGNTVQNGTPTPDAPIPVQVVTGEQTVTVNDGVDSEDFTISLGSIELCKIDDYQDYIYKSGEDWYVHKATNMFTVTSSLTGLGKSGTTSDNAFYYSQGFKDIDKTNMNSGASSTSVTSCYTPYFTSTSTYNLLNSSTIGVSFNKYTNNDNVDFRVGFGVNSNVNTLALFKTWLDDNELKVYYPLATPTDTQITDAALIGQLNTVHEWLTRYGYNSTVTGNLPIIIDRTNL